MGNPEAQYYLGYLYETGKGTVQSKENAKKWYLKSSEQGNVSASLRLKSLIPTGSSNSQNSKISIRSPIEELKLWAQNDDVWAQRNLGIKYLHGEGVTRSYNDARYWLTKAAAGNDSEAQYWLANMYETGQGVSVSYDYAIRLYEKAANQGHTEAANQLQKLKSSPHKSSNSSSNESKTICPVAKAKQYYDNGEYTRAFNLMRSEAIKGNPEAQYYLGLMYESGKGPNQSTVKAIDWYTKSSNQGWTKATQKLQLMKNTVTNQSSGSISQNNPNGMNSDDEDNESSQLPDNYTVAVQYYDKKDYSQAQYLFRGEALKGDARAQFYLGEMYCNGNGVTKSISDAYAWYMKSARGGNADAQNRLGWMYRKGIGVNQSDDEALAWYTLSAKQGHSESQSRLGWFYESGRGTGTSKSYSEAAKWYLKSARQGNEFAQSRLGVLYEKGLGVTQSPNDALYWYQKAAEQGNTYAVTNLNNLKLSLGGYQAENYEFKQAWKAAVKGDPASQSKLGLMFLDGRCVGQSYPDAVKWLDRAASAGNEEAQTKLAWMYLNGVYVGKDIQYAISLYEQAALSGNQEATNALSKLKKQQDTHLEPSKTRSVKKSSSQIKQDSTTSVADFDLIFEQASLNKLLSDPNRFISFLKDLNLPIAMLIILESSIRYAPNSLKTILQSTDNDDFEYRVNKLCSDLGVDYATATTVLLDPDLATKSNRTLIFGSGTESKKCPGRNVQL